MKRPVSIFLLLVFITCYFGYVPLLKYLQSRARREMQELIVQGSPKRQVYRFTFSKAEEQALAWHKEGKEFEKEGWMYDVLAKEEADGRTHYYCFADHKETYYVRTIKDYYRFDYFGRRRRREKEQVIKIPVKWQYCNIIRAFNGFETNLNCHTDIYKVMADDLYQKIPTPPPQNC